MGRALVVVALWALCTGLAQAEVEVGLRPALDSAAVPGFHLCSLESLRRHTCGLVIDAPGIDWPREFPHLSVALEVMERWTTLSPERYAELSARGQVYTDRNHTQISIDRVALETPAQARVFASSCLHRGSLDQLILPDIGPCHYDEDQRPGAYHLDVTFAAGNVAVSVLSFGRDWDRQRAERVVRAVYANLCKDGRSTDYDQNQPEPTVAAQTALPWWLGPSLLFLVLLALLVFRKTPSTPPKGLARDWDDRALCLVVIAVMIACVSYHGYLSLLLKNQEQEVARLRAAVDQQVDVVEQHYRKVAQLRNGIRARREGLLWWEAQSRSQRQFLRLLSSLAPLEGLQMEVDRAKADWSGPARPRRQKLESLGAQVFETPKVSSSWLGTIPASIRGVWRL